MQGIYEIRNNLNGKVYVGSSIDIERRWTEHRRALRNGQHQNVHLQRSWAKYGEDAFVFSILELVESDTLVSTEQRYLDDYFGDDCYNMGQSAAAPMRGRTHTGQARRKMSKAGKGRKFSKEHKRKISEAMMGELNHMWGKHPSEETLRKMSKAHLGKQTTLGYRHTDETRRQMSESHKGHKPTEEARRNMSAAQKRRFARERREKATVTPR